MDFKNPPFAIVYMWTDIVPCGQNVKRTINTEKVSRSIVALQVEQRLLCKLPACCKSRQHVAQITRELNFAKHVVATCSTAGGRR